MKLTPIKCNTIINKDNYYKTGCIKTRDISYDSLSFKGSLDKTALIIKPDVHKISNSNDFKASMISLRKKSLEDRKSYDYFIAASMLTYNKHAINFPIKQDFFESKAKARFVEVVKKIINHEIHEDLNSFLAKNYNWGIFTDKKYGGPESFAAAISCVLPYIKGYEAEINALKLDDIKNKETGLKKDIAGHDKIITAKEQISDVYLKPVREAQKSDTYEVPNSIMLECRDEAIRDEIINWTLANTIARPVIVETNSDDSNSSIKNKLRSALENARQTFDNHHIPTLILCENFDKLLQATNSVTEIGAMKSSLPTIYKKYHATILFTTTNSDTIENILKQPHRMKHIKVE